MSILRALAERPIRTIWLGQVLAATGGEFYTVALVWLAADLVGNDVGYIAALQAGAYLVGSLFVGLVTDRWPHGRTMVLADLARAGLILALPIAQLGDAMSLWLLLTVAIGAAVSGAGFDPALQASVPLMARDPTVRRGANGLFDATRRLARIIGPGLIAVVNGLVPVIQFFTITAGAFLISAGAVALATRRSPQPALPARQAGLAGVFNNLTIGFRALRGHPVVLYGCLAGIIVNISWGAGVIIGLLLLMRETEAEPLTAYGLAMGAYGVGNVLANLVIAGFPQRRPAWRMTTGRLIFGLGLMAMAEAPNLPSLMVIAAVTAINGPLCDLALLELVQSSFPLHLLAPVFRVSSAMAVGGGLLAYVMMPTLLAHFTIRQVIFGSGVISALAGLAGAAYFAWRRWQSSVPRPIIPAGVRKHNP